MAQRARRPSGAWWYVLTADRALPPEQQSRFHLAPLTREEAMRAWDDRVWVIVSPDGTETRRPRAFQQSLELVRGHLINAENFPADAPVPFPTDGTAAQRAAWTDMLEDLDVLELGNEIRNRALLGDAEKNSCEPSPMCDSGGGSPTGTATTAGTAPSIPS